MIVPAVVGTHDAEGMYHHRVQAMFHRVQDRLGRLRFGGGIGADDRIFGKLSRFREGCPFTGLGDGMDRTDIDQPLYMVAHTLRDDVLPAGDIHMVEQRRDLIPHADNPRRMDHDHLAARKVGKDLFQRLHSGNIPLVIGDLFVIPAAFRGEDESPDQAIGAAQIPDDGTRKVPRRARKDIKPFHAAASCPFPKEYLPKRSAAG